MTDLAKQLTEQLESIEQRLSEAQAQRADEANAALKTEYEERIAKLESDLKRSRESLDKVERQGLPGLEYAKQGERDKFSLWRCLQLAVESKDNSRAWENPAYGVEVEAMRQIAEKGGYHPTSERAMNTGTDSAGGVFVPHQVMFDSIIPDLEALATIYQAGAQRMDGLVGELTWIVDQGGTAAYYIDTPSEESATETASTFKTIRAQPHTMSARTRLTRDMLKQSAVSMEAWVRSQFAEQFALREDLSAYRGEGTSSEPRGIANVSGINSLDFDTFNSGVTYTHDAAGPTVQDLSDALRRMIYLIREADYRTAGGSFAWVAEPSVGEKIGNTKDADGQPVFLSNDTGPLSRLMGAPFIDTTQVETGSDTDSFLLYGDFSQCRMLHWGSMEIDVGTEETDLRKGVRTIVGFMDHDVLIQQPKAFTLASNFDIGG